MNASGGSLLPHRKSVRPLITDHLVGGELQWRRRVSGNEHWHQLYALPELGVMMNYSDIGNHAILGKQWSLNPFILLPLGNQGKYLRHHLLFGLGIGFTNKVWNLENNTKNTAISSRFNASILLEYGLEGDFNRKQENVERKLFWSAGLRLHHFSNAAWKMPNLGTNNLALLLGIGMRFRTSTEPAEHLENSSPFERKTGTLQVSYGLGFRENNPPLGTKHAIHTLRLEFSQRLSEKSSLGLSPEVLFNRSLAPFFQSEDEGFSNLDLIQGGLAAQYVLHFSKVSFNAMIGAYVLNKSAIRGDVYARIGLRGQINHRLSAHLMLKAHGFKADHAELGLAYRVKAY